MQPPAVISTRTFEESAPPEGTLVQATAALPNVVVPVPSIVPFSVTVDVVVAVTPVSVSDLELSTVSVWAILIELEAVIVPLIVSPWNEKSAPGLKLFAVPVNVVVWPADGAVNVPKFIKSPPMESAFVSGVKVVPELTWKSPPGDAPPAVVVTVPRGW